MNTLARSLPLTGRLVARRVAAADAPPAWPAIDLNGSPETAAVSATSGNPMNPLRPCG
jgi:hypothetical protein